MRHYLRSLPRFEAGPGRAFIGASDDAAKPALNEPNQRPVITTTSGTTNYVEGANVVADIPVNLELGFFDDRHPAGGDIVSATIQITGNYRPGEDLLQVGPSNFPPVASSWDAATGTLTLTPTQTTTVNDWQNTLRNVRYVNTSDTPDTSLRTISFRASDGEGPGNVATRTLSITPSNDAPAVDLNGAASGINAIGQYTEQAAPVAMVPDAIVVDADSANFAGGQLTVSHFGSEGGPNVISLLQQGSGAGAVSHAGGVVSVGGVAVGTFSGGGNNATPLVVTFNANANAASAQAVLRAVSFFNASDTPPTGAPYFISLTDGDGGTSATAQAFVGIARVDDPLIIDLNGADLGLRGNTAYAAGGAPIAVAPETRLSDLDTTNFTQSMLTIFLTGGRPGDALTIAQQGMGPGQIGVYDGNVVAYEGMRIGQVFGPNTIGLNAQFVTIDAVQALIRAISFGNVNASPDLTPRTVTFQLRAPGGTIFSQSATVNVVSQAAAALYGDTGNNNLTGTTGDDVFRLEQGGNDQAAGGEGADGFFFGGAFNALDGVDGGAGIDQIGLLGAYADLQFGANSTVGVEMVVLLPGSDTRFVNVGGALTGYAITTLDANVAAGQVLSFQANTLRAGENFTLNGAAETDGSFLTFGGLGTETLTGGSQGDGFYFGTGRFNPGDTLNGGGGSDQLGLQGDFAGANALILGAGQLTGIEFIVLLSGADTRFGGGGQNFSYKLTTHDGNVAAGQQMVIQGNTLRAAETLSFDGSAETDGRFFVYGGAAGDTIAGGALGDEIWGLAGADRIEGRGGADTLRGGLGGDVFVYRAVSDSTAAARDRILDFSSGDLLDFSNLDGNANAGGRQAFDLINPGAAFTAAGQLRITQTGNAALIEGDSNGDGAADFAIELNVTDGHLLTVADFAGVTDGPGADLFPLEAAALDDFWLRSAARDHDVHLHLTGDLAM